MICWIMIKRRPSWLRHAILQCQDLVTDIRAFISYQHSQISTSVLSYYLVFKQCFHSLASDERFIATLALLGFFLLVYIFFYFLFYFIFSPLLYSIHVYYKKHKKHNSYINVCSQFYTHTVNYKNKNKTIFHRNITMLQ